MHKIDGAGHLGNMFVWEDPLLNRPPTEITAEWLNAVQIELATVIEWSGIALNKANNGQLLQALQAKFASIAPSGDYAVKLAVQSDSYKAAAADVVGAPDAIVAAFVPAITGLVSAHGMTLYVRGLAANATATPTFTPNNGTISAKTIVKGNNLPLVPGDIAGAGFWMELRYDITLDKWVLMNPAKGIAPVLDEVGFIKLYAASTPPPGYLACPTAPTNISRSTYAALFAALGTTWGAGDGATSFGMPWFPSDYTALQAGGGAVGSASLGSVIAHFHDVLGVNRIYGGSGNYGNALTEGSSPSGNDTSTVGGSANLAAGHRVKFCIKY
ncbi:MAG: phage tail protein [Methylicorpusculum sp.]|uniref:phage tail protein n=1 Tax=Methylicorpusculum sp. TaxID=2713644 RepID=UPI0027259B88|nr:phage tail protein [Methylicorpusculum sp.]MDO8941480.1 phage tail protein [Methylicorpusculum sp.]